MNRPDKADQLATHRQQVTSPRPPPPVKPRVHGKKERDLYQKFYSISEFIHSFDLPQAARVVEGYYGTTKASTIDSGTVLLFYSQRTTKVVLTENGQSIPCDSSLMYAPLDATYGFEGHVYNSVNELLSCPKLPKVVHIDGKTAIDLCLSDNSQLIFPYQKEQDLIGRNCLICYDQRNTKFKLSATKHGSFSTKPDDIKMDMHSCIKHIRGFPYSVAKFSADGNVFPVMDNSILTLTGMSIKQSVTTKILSGIASDETSVIEIPIDIPLKLQCQQKKESTSVSVNQNTDELQDHAYTIIKPRTPQPPEGEYMTLTNVLASEGKGQALPQALISQRSHLLNAHDHQAVLKHSARLSRQISGPVQSYSTDRISVRPQSAIVEGATAADDSDDGYTVILPSDKCVINPPVNKPMYEEPEQQLERIQKLEASNKLLLAEVTRLQACVNELTHLVVTKNPENNIKQLSSMDVDAVLIMLQAMDLSQYEHIFKKNKINGQNLAQLDRKKLSQHGITNIKDQSILEDLIKGRVSPLLYLLRLPSNNPADSYAGFANIFRELNHHY